jgi:hypothetical protein
MEDQIVYWRTLTCRRSQIHICGDCPRALFYRGMESRIR